MLVEEESRREIERLQQMIDESQKIVFFGGAGGEYLPRVGFLISEVQTGCISKIVSIPRSRL